MDHADLLLWELLANPNWVGAVFQVVMLIVGVFIYMPFIKSMDKQYLADEAAAAQAEEEEDDINLDDLSFDDL